MGSCSKSTLLFIAMQRSLFNATDFLNNYSLSSIIFFDYNIVLLNAPSPQAVYFVFLFAHFLFFIIVLWTTDY